MFVDFKETSKPTRLFRVETHRFYYSLNDKKKGMLNLRKPKEEETNS
jgi:hypothetical protein